MSIDAATRAAFVAWSIAPETERTTRKLFAELHDVNESTLTRWVKQDWFVQQVDEAYAKLELTPEKLQAVVDALEKKARDGDPRAIDLYLKHHEKVMAKGQQVTEVSELDDAALAEELREALASVESRMSSAT
jgi:hypothetical protein